MPLHSVRPVTLRLSKSLFFTLIWNLDEAGQCYQLLVSRYQLTVFGKAVPLFSVQLENIAFGSSNPVICCWPTYIHSDALGYLESRKLFPLWQYFIISVHNAFSKRGQMCKSRFSLPSFPLGSWFSSGCVVQQHNYGPCKAGDGRLLLEQYLLQADNSAEVLPICSPGSEILLWGGLAAHCYWPFSGELWKGHRGRIAWAQLVLHGEFQQGATISKVQVFERSRGSMWIGEEEWLCFKDAVYILLTGKKPAVMPIPLAVQFVWFFGWEGFF